MKPLIPITFLALVAAIVYLVVSETRNGAADSSLEGVSSDATREDSDSKAEGKRSRTPHLVQTLIDPSQHIDEQIEAIRALPTDLTEGEFQALMNLLRDDCPVTMRANVWSTLQNEIMEVLRQRRFDIPQYPEAIAGILSDREADPIMRDYAAQHLSLYLSDRAKTLATSEMEQGLDSLINILTGTRAIEQQVTGTTLMGLCALNQKHPALLNTHRPALSDSILHLLDFEHPVTFSNRISAIQAAGRLQVDEALPLVRQMAQSNDGKPSFKISAIATLGYFAQAEDQPFLEEVAQSDSKFRFAAQTALKNF